MKRAVLACLMFSLAAFGACKDNEPPRSGISKYTAEDVQEKPDQTDPNTCFGEPRPTGRSPFDMPCRRRPKQGVARQAGQDRCENDADLRVRDKFAVREGKVGDE